MEAIMRKRVIIWQQSFSDFLNESANTQESACHPENRKQIRNHHKDVCQPSKWTEAVPQPQFSVVNVVQGARYVLNPLSRVIYILNNSISGWPCPGLVDRRCVSV